MKLYVARHSQTEGNVRGEINGQLDDPLTSQGINDIDGLVAQLHDAKLDAVFCSTLSRAVMTATPIAKDHSLEPTQDKRLVEVGMGTYEGQSYKSTIQKFGLDSPGLLSTYAYDMTPYGGESAEQVKERVSSFIDELKNKDLDFALVVTHGGIIRWFHYLCTGEKIGSSTNLSVREYDL